MKILLSIGFCLGIIIVVLLVFGKWQKDKPGDSGISSKGGPFSGR